jgi:hypothetical protein
MHRYGFGADPGSKDTLAVLTRLFNLLAAADGKATPVLTSRRRARPKSATTLAGGHERTNPEAAGRSARSPGLARIPELERTRKSKLQPAMNPFKIIQFVLTLAAIGLSVQGCATRNVNPHQARANTGYVDFHAGPSAELSWEVSRWDDRSRDFDLVFWDLDPPPGGILRLAFAPGRHRLRVAFLNCVVKKPAEVEVEVQDGKILPIRVKLTEAGTTVVETKEQERGGTAFGRYGRRTKFGSEEMMMYDIAIAVAPPVAYQPREQMPYAH